MKVAITGGTGYIGKHLTDVLSQDGHELLFISRQMLYGDPDILAEYIRKSDAVVNLAGAPILQRWTTFRKVSIYNSRVITTKNLCLAINQIPKPDRPKTFIGASAIGIYQALARHDETSTNFAINYIGKVSMDWEAASLQLDKSVRRVIFRTGLVIGKESAIIKKILPLYKFGLGGWIGNGMQAFPFIHIDDVLKAYSNAIKTKAYVGIFNLVAPEKINNKQFSKKLAHAINRPALFSVPNKALKLMFGEASDLLTTSPEIIPQRLVNMGFSFQHADIDSAILEIIT